MVRTDRSVPEWYKRTFPKAYAEQKRIGAIKETPTLEKIAAEKAGAQGDMLQEAARKAAPRSTTSRAAPSAKPKYDRPLTKQEQQFLESKGGTIGEAGGVSPVTPTDIMLAGGAARAGLGIARAGGTAAVRSLSGTTIRQTIPSALRLGSRGGVTPTGSQISRAAVETAKTIGKSKAARTIGLTGLGIAAPDIAGKTAELTKPEKVRQELEKNIDVVRSAEDYAYTQNVARVTKGREGVSEFAAGTTAGLVYGTGIPQVVDPNYKKDFMEQVRKGLKEKGYSAAEAKRLAKEFSDIALARKGGQVLGSASISAGAETAGQLFVGQATKKAGAMTTKEAAKYVTFKVAPRIGAAGFIEGAGGEVIQKRAEFKQPEIFTLKMDKAKGVPLPSVGGVIGSGIYGFGTSQFIGGGLGILGVAGRRTAGKAYSVGTYIADPFEYIGDVSASRLGRAFGDVGEPSLRVRAISPTAQTPLGKKTPPTKPAARPAPATRRSPVSVFVPTVEPTRPVSKAVTTPAQPTPRPKIETPVREPVTSPVPEPVLPKPVTPVPSEKTETIIREEVPVVTQVPIMPYTPMFRGIQPAIPLPLPPFGGVGQAKGKKKRGGIAFRRELQASRKLLRGLFG